MLINLSMLFAVAEKLTLCSFFLIPFPNTFQSIYMLSSFSNTCFNKFFIAITTQDILNKEDKMLVL